MGAAGRDGPLGCPQRARRSVPTLFVKSVTLHQIAPILNALPLRAVFQPWQFVKQVKEHVQMATGLEDWLPVVASQRFQLHLELAADMFD
jgi:hypothetical protein